MEEKQAEHARHQDETLSDNALEAVAGGDSGTVYRCCGKIFHALEEYKKHIYDHASEVQEIIKRMK